MAVYTDAETIVKSCENVLKHVAEMVSRDLGAFKGHVDSMYSSSPSASDTRVDRLLEYRAYACVAEKVDMALQSKSPDLESPSARVQFLTQRLHLELSRYPGMDQMFSVEYVESRRKAIVEYLDALHSFGSGLNLQEYITSLIIGATFDDLGDDTTQYVRSLTSLLNHPRRTI